MDCFILPDECTLKKIAGIYLFEAGQSSLLMEYAELEYKRDDLIVALELKFPQYSEQLLEAILKASTPCEDVNPIAG